MQRSPVRNISSTPNREIKRSRTSTSEMDLVTEPVENVFVAPHNPKFLNLLSKKDDYVHLFIPKDLATAFSEFLGRSGTALNEAHSIIVVEDDCNDLHFLIDKFNKNFKPLLTALTDELPKHTHSKYTEELTQEAFLKFKQIRGLVTKWFVHCKHLDNKLTKGNTPTNRYCKLAMQFSPAVKNEELRDKCNSSLINLRDKLEKELSASVIEEANSLTNQLSDEFRESKLNPEDLFLLCKALRTVLLNNRELAGKLIDKIPKQPDRPPPRFRPYGQDNTNYRSQFNNQRHRRYNQQIDQQDSRPPTQYRRYHNRGRQDRHFNEAAPPKAWNRNRQHRLSHRLPSSRDGSVSEYDRDFPKYNQQFKQKSYRYNRNNNNDNDEVFENIGRHYRNHSHREPQWQ